MNIRTLFSAILAATLFLIIDTSVMAQETETPAANPWMMPWGSSAMQRSMDPEVYNNMFKMFSQNPELMMNPNVMCAQCHDGEAMARYQKTIMPMFNLMMNPANWMNPNAYMQAMTPMMDPQTYTEYYNAMMKMMNPGPEYGSQDK